MRFAPLVQTVPIGDRGEALLDDEGQLGALLEVEPRNDDVVRGRACLREDADHLEAKLFLARHVRARLSRVDVVEKRGRAFLTDNTKVIAGVVAELGVEGQKPRNTFRSANSIPEDDA